MTQHLSETSRKNANNEPLSHPPEASPKRKRPYSDPNDTKPDFSTLSQRQRKYLNVIADARTVTEAAALSRLSRSTIHRWLRDETFREALAYTRASNDFLFRLRIQNKTNNCLDMLHEAAQLDPDSEVRIRAARALLAFVVQTGQWKRIEDSLQPLDDELFALPGSWSEPALPQPLPLPSPRRRE